MVGTDGMPMPSGEAQLKVIREACESAGIDPGSVGYVEAHGTGTRAGDPVEAAALGRAYGQHPSRRTPCRVGSVKTNIGHLEAAAGVAGLIKAALSVKNRKIAPLRALNQPNPEIDFDKLGLQLATTVEPWPTEYETPLAAVNAFGYGGTNAHAILAYAAPSLSPPVKAPPQERPWLLPISAHGREALAKRAQDLIPSQHRAWQLTFTMSATRFPGAVRRCS